MTNRMVPYLLFFFLLCFLAAEFLLNLTPPITRDALIHHLAIPKLWIKHGGFYETPWADFSYYPMNINLLYLIPLYFGNDILPKFIHMAFGLGTGFLVYLYLKEKFNHRWGLLGLIIFFTTPIVVWLSTSAYIDLGAAFFCTASVLTYSKWRERAYLNIKWLIASSCLMGLAVGSKYNIMVGWFIVNLMVVMFYARDTKKQLTALKYGVVFFVVCTAVASPWLIKNYIQTDNPFYPLFNKFISSLQHHQSLSQTVGEQIVGTAKKNAGFFRLRGYMYNETFLETLAIPIRMFFQGDDASYQYFQGRLNPILIVFFPFVFLTRKFGKGKSIFILFSFFFLWVAYFTTEKQVRYILPVIPFFTILSVIGIKNIWDYRLSNPSTLNLVVQKALFFCIILLLLMNVSYLKEHFQKINPLPYVLHKESKNGFLERHLLHYPAVEFINTHLPEDAVVYTIYLGRRGYYLDREYINDTSFGITVLRRLVESSEDETEFMNTVISLGASHILIRIDLADQFLQTNYEDEQRKHFFNIINSKWNLLFRQGNFAVWKINII